jgi:ABC-type multidrug transport system ATPase subunit
MNNEILLNIKDMNVNFDNQKIFQNFNLSISRNDKVVITGSSGKGKSTLLNVVMGFIPYESGEVYYDNYLIDRINIRNVRNNIAWLPQEINSQMSVKEFVKSPSNFRINKSLIYSDEVIESYLNEFLLDKSILEKSVSQISGGEKQRIALITSLLLKRNFLLLDEPVSALDSTAKEKVINYIFSLKDVTILSTSHDEKWMDKCNRIIEI